MSALVSTLLALAFDQLWLPLQQEVAANAAFLYGDVDAEDELPQCPVKSPERVPEVDTTTAMCITHTNSSSNSSSNSNTNSSSSKKQLRNARRKKQSPSPQPKSAPPVETTKKNAENLSSDFHSDASTCGSSDEEDHEDAEDIGERERKLMLARAQQVKNITTLQQQQQQQSRVAKRAPSRKKAAAAPVAAAPARKQLQPEPSYPDVCAPLRLRNVTNTLWHWSVFSGFQVDRFPLDHDCCTNEADEEAWEGSDLRDQLLQMLDGDDGK